MKKRYYYDCPIEAAYMSKNFGMKFICFNTDEEMQEYDIPEPEREFNWEDSSIFLGDTHTIGEILEQLGDLGRRIYIAPESLVLLEPAIGDILHFRDNHVGWLNEHGDIETAGDRVIGHIRSGHEWKIIQRDGKPFIRPKKEEV